MTVWWYFWTLSFAVAGASFTGIALVVLIRGAGDLRKMVRYLSNTQEGFKD